MAKYKVLRDCYGFQNRYWEKGEIAEIDPKDNPSQHFERMDKKIVEEKKRSTEEKMRIIERIEELKAKCGMVKSLSTFDNVNIWVLKPHNLVVSSKLIL